LGRCSYNVAKDVEVDNAAKAFANTKYDFLLIWDWDDTLFPSSLGVPEGKKRAGRTEKTTGKPIGKFPFQFDGKEAVVKSFNAHDKFDTTSSNGLSMLDWIEEYDQRLVDALKPLEALQGYSLKIAISSRSSFATGAIERLPQTKHFLKWISADGLDGPEFANDWGDYKNTFGEWDTKTQQHRLLVKMYLKEDGSVIAIGDNATHDFEAGRAISGKQKFYAVKLPYQFGRLQEQVMLNALWDIVNQIILLIQKSNNWMVEGGVLHVMKGYDKKPQADRTTNAWVPDRCHNLEDANRIYQEAVDEVHMQN